MLRYFYIIFLPYFIDTSACVNLLFSLSLSLSCILHNTGKGSSIDKLRAAWSTSPLPPSKSSSTIQQQEMMYYSSLPHDDIDCILSMTPHLNTYCIQSNVGYFYHPTGEETNIQVNK